MSVTLSPTVVRLGTRSVFGHKRGILLLVLPVVLLGLAGLIRGLAGQDPRISVEVLQSLGLTVVVPLVALLSTTGLLAPEIDDGSISYLLAKPISRHTIVLSKLLVALGCVVAFAVVPMFVADLFLYTDEPGLALAFAAGSLAGGAAYCALFAFLSVLTRHAVVIGLLYLLVWEGLLGGQQEGPQRGPAEQHRQAHADVRARTLQQKGGHAGNRQQCAAGGRNADLGRGVASEGPAAALPRQDAGGGEQTA